MWASSESTAWTVVLETEARFQVSCLNRFVYVKAVRDAEEALQGAEPVRENISTVGLAAAGTRAAELARQFARWGARRICPLGRDAKAAAGLAARRPAGAGGFADLERVGEMKQG
jgi:hypothetical protein